MTIYCPSNIEVLLHCHTSPSPHPRLDAPAVSEAIQSFMQAGVIEYKAGNVYQTTPLGAAWVNALCDVELPKRAFVDKQGKILGYDS